MGKKTPITFLKSPIGTVISALLIWGIGYILFLLATDSGSLLQWAGVLTAFLWGAHRLVQGGLAFRRTKS